MEEQLNYSLYLNHLLSLFSVYPTQLHISHSLSLFSVYSGKIIHHIHSLFGSFTIIIHCTSETITHFISNYI